MLHLEDVSWHSIGACTLHSVHDANGASGEVKNRTRVGQGSTHTQAVRRGQVDDAPIESRVTGRGHQLTRPTLHK